MYLDKVRAAQGRGEALGVTSVCSAHPDVLRETLRLAHQSGVPALIESTCNQVNQFGGYTGMTPAKFAEFLRGLAAQAEVAPDDLLLGGDHLGPSAWRDEPAEAAMAKARELVRAYAAAGYVKIHLDCSMRLKDDAPAGPSPATIAERAGQLARTAEESSHGELRYVIGTEVPAPGGATAHARELPVTSVADASEAIELHRLAFKSAGVASAWERVVAVVVQPGVEFGDDFVVAYQPSRASGLSRFIETEGLMYEAHSTDYQELQALRALVRDHFAILKVGPALTYAYREAVFALAAIEFELVPAEQRSNLIEVVDRAMVRDPRYWENYYHGSGDEKAFRRKYSLSDRVRYYWHDPEIQQSLEVLRKNVSANPIPSTLLDRYARRERDAVLGRGHESTFEALISERILLRLQDYFTACKPVH